MHKWIHQEHVDILGGEENWSVHSVQEIQVVSWKISWMWHQKIENWWRWLIYFKYVVLNFVEKKRIEHEIIASYTPKHDYIIETKNKRILSIAKSMLTARWLRNYFWGEATSTAVHIIDRYPSKKLIKEQHNMKLGQTWSQMLLI